MNTIIEFLNSLKIPDYSIIKDVMGYVSKWKICKLSKEFSYWEIETYGNDAQKNWENGCLILKHKITIDSILIGKDQFIEMMKYSKVMDFNEWLCKDEDKIHDVLIARSDEIKASGVLKPGFLFWLGVADGNATYIVKRVNKKSVTVELLKFVDGYHGS